MNTTIFIAQLNDEKQEKIKKLIIEVLTEEGYQAEEIKEIVSNAMNDRLCNLEDFIDITPFLSREKAKVIKLEDYR